MKTYYGFYSLLLALLIAAGGCAQIQQTSDSYEAREAKVRLDQVPAPARQTIERELAGAKLEDIAMETRQGKTVYETDIIRDGHKWEVVVADDGQVLSKIKEGKASEEADQGSSAASDKAWRDRFAVSKSNLAAAGNNPYFPLQPGRVLKLAHGNERLTVSVLPGTKVVDGVTVGVLEEREEKDGRLIEISRNYFATDPATGDVYYFGEDVDNYKDDQIVNHDSAWLSGQKGARFGLFMPGKPRAGDRFYQEIAPQVALDRVEIVSLNETVTTPAGTFPNCVHFRETTPLEPGVSHKFFAPNIGIIKDDEFELTEKP